MRLRVLVVKLRRAFPKGVKFKLPRGIKIVKVSKKDSRRLNLVYRKKNKSANILSFRYGRDYGEILVCPEIIRQEAKKQGNSYQYQMTWMILHGMIHLAGMHHENSKKKAKLFGRIEKEVLRKLVVLISN